MKTVWLILMVAGGTAVAVFQQRRARARARQVAAWAHAHGLTYRPGPDRRLAHRFLEFPALSQGDQAVAANICQGSLAGREMWVFDLSWQVRDRGDDRSLTAVLVKADLPLIPLRIRHETAIERLGEAFGQVDDDIDFESAAFSDRFHVWSADRKFARDVIHPRTMEYLLDKAAWPIELAGWHCLVWSGSRLAPAQLDDGPRPGAGRAGAHSRTRAARVARPSARKGMTMIVKIVVGVVVAVGLWLFVTYNRLVRLRQYCRESWATIDTELKRRSRPGAEPGRGRPRLRGARGRHPGGGHRGAAARPGATPREIAARGAAVVTGTAASARLAEQQPELKAERELPAPAGRPRRHRGPHPVRRGASTTPTSAS